jgi:hypothetical protein
MTTWKLLSSLDLSWWVLIFMILWLALGSLVSSDAMFQEGLSGMNELLVRKWLSSQGLEHPWTLSWFGVLVLLALTLGCNLAACLWNRVRNNTSIRGLRFWVFIGLHIVFGAVMLLHALETVVGQKYPQQSVRAGEEVALSAGWTLNILDVVYVNDPALLRLTGQDARQAMTRESFDLEANCVHIALSREGQTRKEGKIHMLRPFEHAGYYVVLRGFVAGPDGVGAKIRVVNSPVHTPFLFAYGLLIGSFMAWLLLSVRPKA